jgi:hypothetical protein
MTAVEYVRARTVLLDALDALDKHRDAVVLVGAQAVYLHAGDADFVTAPTTTDADLVLAPDVLAGRLPAIEDAMVSAGFVAGGDPGMWFGRGHVTVDLLVPEAVSGPGGRRAARLPEPHGKKAARKTFGLEPALVDNDVHVLRALDDDPRSFALKVAGPAALLVAKVVKIAERRTQPGRLLPKDGLDVLRLLRATDVDELGAKLVELLQEPLSSAVVGRALEELRTLARDPDALLPRLAARAEEGFEDPDVLGMSMVVLVGDVLAAVKSGTT